MSWTGSGTCSARLTTHTPAAAKTFDEHRWHRYRGKSPPRRRQRSPQPLGGAFLLKSAFDRDQALVRYQQQAQCLPPAL